MLLNKYGIQAAAIGVLIILGFLAGSSGHAETRADQEEKDFYLSSVLPAVSKVKNAVPPAPDGWIVSGETKVNPLPVPGIDEVHFLSFGHTITYKRVDGVRQEREKLDNAYAESSRRNHDAAKSRIDELIRQQTETSLALRKASRRRNAAEEKRLNDELEENGKKLGAVHEDVDRKICRDVEQFLIRDAEATISIAVNDETAGLQRGEPFPMSGAAFALRSDGEQAGTTRWKEGQSLILYGDWQRVGNNVFRGTVKRVRQGPKAQTIKITITGEGKRAEQLLKRMDLKAILSLMK
jgi:hypothetical protein